MSHVKNKASELFYSFYRILRRNNVPNAKEIAQQLTLNGVDQIITAMDEVLYPNPFKPFYGVLKEEVEKIEVKEKDDSEDLEQQILDACREYEYTDEDNHSTAFVNGFAAGAKWMKNKQ